MIRKKLFKSTHFACNIFAATSAVAHGSSVYEGKRLFSYNLMVRRYCYLNKMTAKHSCCLWSVWKEVVSSESYAIC